MLSARAPLGLFLPVLLCAGIACRSDPTYTGLRVEIKMNGLTVDQLLIAVSNSKDFLPNANYAPRPQMPAGKLADPQVVEIYVRDELDKTRVSCQVRGQWQGGKVGGGCKNSTLVLHQLVPTSIILDPDNKEANCPLPDAGAGDGSVDGDAADRRVDAVAADRTPAADAADPPIDGGPAPLGIACKQAADCASGLCVDGVCCSSSICGNCRACNVADKLGTCAPVTKGTPGAMCTNQKMAGQVCGFDGTCDGQGACFRPAAGQACGQLACNGANLVPPAACDGQGACMPAVQVSCAPYGCDATGSKCRTTCTVNADCAPNTQCTKNSCGTIPRKANGAGCLANADCTSNICADGVCCNMTCKGMCESCALTGQVGTCSPVPNGKPDPHGLCTDTGVASCGTNGMCNGARGCTHYADGLACQPAQCLGHAVVPQQVCTAGACTGPAQVDCGNYRCNPATVTCFSNTCTTDAECATESGYRCRGGKCR